MKNKKTEAQKAYDVLLSESALLAMREMGKEMERTNAKADFSEEHKKRMEKLFKKDIRRSGHRTLKYVSCAACLILGVVIGSNFAVPKGDAWLSKVLNYFFDADAPGTKYSFSDESGVPFEDEKIFLGYVPAGFELTNESHTEHFHDYRFRSENQYFDISVTTTLEGQGSVDTEGGVVKDIKINGHEGFYCEARDLNSVVWHDGQNIYKVMGDVPIEEIFKIAETLEKK